MNDRIKSEERNEYFCNSMDELNPIIEIKEERTDFTLKEDKLSNLPGPIYIKEENTNHEFYKSLPLELETYESSESETLAKPPLSAPREWNLTPSSEKIRKSEAISATTRVLSLIGERIATSKPQDEWDMRGKIVAAKLRKMPYKMQVLADKLINDILFEAHKGSLNHATKICSIQHS